MPKIELNKLSLKPKRQMYLFSIFILIFIARFVVFSDIKKLKRLSLENLTKQTELSSKKSEFFSLESIIKDQASYEDECNQAKNTLEVLKSKIVEINNSLIKKESIADISYYLTSLAKPEEIEFSLINMGPMVEYDKYNEFPVKMKINTDYLKFMSYIKKLESLSFYLGFKKLKINSQEDNGIVNVETEFVFYVTK